MKQKIVLIISGLLILAGIGLLVFYKYFLTEKLRREVPIINSIIPQKEVIGFLPYWLTGKAQNDYSKYITTLTYFSLTVSPDGTIQKFTKPSESEPGYLSLTEGKIDPFLNSAKANDENISVSVFNGNDSDIGKILTDPAASANNLTNDVIPIMQKYGFTDLNLDVEQTRDASPEARMKFTEFVKDVKSNLDEEKIGTLSIDVSAIAFVKNTNLSDPAALAPIVDKIILMAYDYHSTISLVTGPVAPLSGAGTVSEFDTEAAISAALKIMPAKKIILGIPLYGYEWETIGSIPRSATIPGTSLIISNQRAEDFLAGCATCSAVFDTTDAESHIIYQTGSGTYQQIFYPSETSTQVKIDLANKYSLGGIALWALGYEGKTTMTPLASYK
jgi:spore germination protein YaaH